MGAHLVPRLERNRSPADRLVLQCLWPQTFLHGLRGDFYSQFIPVRTCAEPADVGLVPSDSRGRRRWFAADFAGNPGGSFPPRKAGHGHGHLRNGSGGCAHDWPDARRLDHGQFHVALDKGQRDDWFGSNFIVWATVFAGAALIGAVIWELRQKDPIVDLRLLKERNFSVALFTMYVLGFVLYGTTVLLPILLQTLMGYTAMQSGFVLLPGGVVLLMTLPFVGILLSKFEARWLVVAGLAIIGAGLFAMSHFNLEMSSTTPINVWSISRFGMAFMFVPINVIAFYYVLPKKINDATGLINLARNVGGSMGISFVTTLLDRGAQFHQSVLAAHVTPLSQNLQAALQGMEHRFIEHGSSAAQALSQAERLIYATVQRQAMMLSFIDDFRIMAFITLLMIPFMFILKKAKPGKRNVPMH